jgi:uncharacterized small protein (DUF1192 family)
LSNDHNYKAIGEAQARIAQLDAEIARLRAGGK